MLFTTSTTTIHTLPILTCGDVWPCPRLTRSLLDYTVRPNSPALELRLVVNKVARIVVSYLTDPTLDVRAVLVAGAGFFLDSYDIFAINLITTLLGVVFYSSESSLNGYGGNDGILPDPVNQALKASTSGGIVLGMIIFGWLAE